MPGFLSEVLTWSENYDILLAVETALELKMPPTEFINPNKVSTGRWSGLDKRLALAHKLMSNETCKMCGNPIWVCRNEDRNVDFSIRVGTCHSKQNLDKDEERRSKAKTGKLKAGQYLYSVPMQVNGQPLPHGTRKSYFESLSED